MRYASWSEGGSGHGEVQVGSINQIDPHSQIVNITFVHSNEVDHAPNAQLVHMALLTHVSMVHLAPSRY